MGLDSEVQVVSDRGLPSTSQDSFVSRSYKKMPLLNTRCGHTYGINREAGWYEYSEGRKNTPLEVVTGLQGGELVGRWAS